jgi:peptide/nickel transport system substrate-binding protein
MPFRRSLILVLLVWLVLSPGRLLAAGSQLVIGISQFPSTFNPLIDSMAARDYILGLARRPFTAFDKDWQLACLLCTRLPTLENGLATIETLPSGKPAAVVTFTIQPGATWGDGVPVTTDDVLFTWEVGRNPQSGVASAELFRRIRSIEVKDAKTFTLHFDRLTFDYNDISDFQLLPAHLERPAFANPVEYRNKSLYEADTTNPGLYFGPYRISEVARGQYVVLDRNPTWYGKPPQFDRIVVKSIEAAPALEANLLAGGIDMVAGEIGMPMEAALAFERRQRPEWVVVYKPGLVYEHMTVNVDTPILADRRVRQALLYGFDRETLVDKLFQGKQKVAATLVNPLDWCADPEVKPYPYDPAKAARLLDEAGWRLSADGRRRNAKGEKLWVEIMTTAGNRGREIIELVAQQDWKRLGIAVNLRNQPARTFFGDAVLKHAFPSLALFAWLSAPESVPRAELHSAMVPAQANNFSGENVGGYRNQRMDELIDAIEVQLDREKRRRLWYQLQALYAEELPDLPITFRADPFILPRWLKGVEPTGHQFPTTLWVENWWVDNRQAEK